MGRSLNTIQYVSDFIANIIYARFSPITKYFTAIFFFERDLRPLVLVQVVFRIQAVVSLGPALDPEGSS